jgi:hypothetical protein
MTDVEYVAVSRMRIGRGNRNPRSKPALVPLCSAQIPYDLTWARTWVTAVGNRRLTAWACHGLGLQPSSYLIHSVLSPWTAPRAISWREGIQICRLSFSQLHEKQLLASVSLCETPSIKKYLAFERTASTKQKEIHCCQQYEYINAKKYIYIFS